MKRVCLYCVLLWAAVACAPGDNKYSERDFVGIWVEPVPGMAGVQGIALEEDGAAHSVNMATLRYETWKYEKEAWNPSYTATAKANGPRIASTIRKNVRMVSMIREAQSKSSSSSQ